MIKKLPLIELLIDPDKESFVSAISLVSQPAVESSFIVFSDDKTGFNNYQQFKFDSDEKKELMGIAMRADTPIYRNDPAMGEFLVTFSKDTIRLITQTFAKKGFNNNMNLEHSTVDAESFVFQSYVVDDEKGITAPKNIDAKDGDWIVGVKVESDAVWNDIKGGLRSGFSVEGIFDLIDTKTIIDFQFATSQPLTFEQELDALISKYNL
ncbi:XkdF-like putative serine protease domain-containing protein [Pedobacter sp. MC2016-05]|uniref:XkdF-like putative serine protease domain-containing protein n=1 Tax=Pedobacter sp. MC2016-05 TaxID=2994474 RepID=UPI002247B71E|nr:XkdF-like putative serine protease domain-containing protein [Pedobacter sp. MC2016-05]MCX2474090.1 XkdF-like putative serine protease domain-containing protein [Pedobacter sp. MC2016-05]